VAIGYAIVTADDPGPTPGDRTAANFAEDLRTDWLTSIVEVVSVLGSWPAVVIVTLLTSTWLWMRGHRPELVVLLLGVAVLLIAPPVLKDIVDRPRPEGGLVDAAGSAYPSGHATHAVIYAWIALQVALRLRPGMQRASALIAAGLFLAAAIGLSRVYLGVHYMSDVSGGWALGASAFALLAVVAILVVHFRQNGSRMRSE
jgi:membrane-associated phospholipid phosphatase